MSTTVKTNQTPEKLTTWLAAPAIKERIGSALAGYMELEPFMSQMIISLQNETVADCTEQSKFEAVHQCAALGLLPSLSQVALIPREIKNKGKVCTVMPQWQGYQALMLRHPEVATVKAVLVHVRDSYSFDPLSEQLIHEFDPFDAARTITKLDDIRGGYLRITYRDGRLPLYHFVTVDTIRKARDCAQSKNIWDKWFQEQALKTVYRNAYARRVVPVDHLVHSRLQNLVEADDLALENDPNRAVVLPVSVAPITHKPSRAEQLQAKISNREQRTEQPREVPEQKPEEPQQAQPLTDHAINEATTVEQLDRLADQLKAEREQMDQDAYEYLNNMIGAKRKSLGKK